MHVLLGMVLRGGMLVKLVLTSLVVGLPVVRVLTRLRVRVTTLQTLPLA
jgi:hypothetical protein